MRYLIAALITLVCCTSGAEARHYRHHRHHVAQHHVHHYARAHRHTRHYAYRINRSVRYVDATLVSHPEGCPRSAFCGCGAAVRIFGRPVRELWLAANWYKFPRTSPAPGTVGVRRHHVFVLESHIGGDVWRVYDANSGGHATRIHARSISGYTIVNPRA